MSAHQSECILQSACFMHSDTTNIDQSVAEWLKNVVEAQKPRGTPWSMCSSRRVSNATGHAAKELSTMLLGNIDNDLSSHASSDE